MDFGLRLLVFATLMLILTVFTLGGGDAGAATLAGTARDDGFFGKTLFVSGSDKAMGAEVRGAVVGALSPIYVITAFVFLLMTSFAVIRWAAQVP